jgi:AraC family transcriptional regulator
MADAREEDACVTISTGAGDASAVMGRGSLQYFASDGGQDAIQVLVPDETAAIGAVYRTEGGSERRAFVRAPLVSVIPPGLAWRIHCVRPGATLVLRISPQFYAERVRAALGQTTRLAARFAAFDPFIRTIADTLLHEFQGDHSPNAALLEPLAAVMAVHLARHYGATTADAGTGPCGLPSHRLRRVQAFIKDHLAEVIRVERLAAEIHMSPYHFARMFKQATGQPPHLYVVMQRVSHAKGLLQDTELPLLEVAELAGFRTQGHFTGVFRRYTGQTPRAFRLGCRSVQAF